MGQVNMGKANDAAVHSPIGNMATGCYPARAETAPKLQAAPKEVERHQADAAFHREGVQAKEEQLGHEEGSPHPEENEVIQWRCLNDEKHQGTHLSQDELLQHDCVQSSQPTQHVKREKQLVDKEERSQPEEQMKE